MISYEIIRVVYGNNLYVAERMQIILFYKFVKNRVNIII